MHLLDQYADHEQDLLKYQLENLRHGVQLQDLPNTKLARWVVCLVVLFYFFEISDDAWSISQLSKEKKALLLFWAHSKKQEMHPNAWCTARQARSWQKARSTTHQLSSKCQRMVWLEHIFGLQHSQKQRWVERSGQKGNTGCQRRRTTSQTIIPVMQKKDGKGWDSEWHPSALSESWLN